MITIATPLCTLLILQQDNAGLHYTHIIWKLFVEYSTQFKIHYILHLSGSAMVYSIEHNTNHFQRRNVTSGQLEGIRNFHSTLMDAHTHICSAPGRLDETRTFIGSTMEYFLCAFNMQHNFNNSAFREKLVDYRTFKSIV